MPLYPETYGYERWVERLCDLGAGAWWSEEQGKPPRPLLAPIIVPPEPEPADKAAERAHERLVRGLWWDAHYWGMPSREQARQLARWRAAIRSRRNGRP